MSLRENNTVKVERSPFYVRRGEIDFLSLELKSNEGSKFYVLCKYEFPSPNTLRLILPDPQIVGEAVVRGELKGEAKSAASGDVPVNADEGPETNERANNLEKEDKPSDDSKELGLYNWVGLTDSPKAIIEFLEKNNSKCFKHTIVYQRLGDERSSE